MPTQEDRPAPLGWKECLPPLLLCGLLLLAGLVVGFLQEEPDSDEPV